MKKLRVSKKKRREEEGIWCSKKRGRGDLGMNPWTHYTNSIYFQFHTYKNRSKKKKGNKCEKERWEMRWGLSLTLLIDLGMKNFALFILILFV